MLRPLSAKLLPLTVPEKEGLVKREKLLNISGRSRKPQLALAEKYGLENYPSPAGGCLLTDPGFSKRLRKLLEWKGRLELNDVELIKKGRILFENKTLIVIGRNKKENKALMKNALESDFIIITIEKPGPVTIIRSFEKSPQEDIIEKASLLTIRYSKGKKLPSLTVKIKHGEEIEYKKYSYIDWEKYFLMFKILKLNFPNIQIHPAGLLYHFSWVSALVYFNLAPNNNGIFLMGWIYTPP